MPVIGQQNFANFQQSLVAQQQQAQNFALALKRLQFETDVHKARQKYQDEMLKMEKETSRQRAELHQLQMQKADIENQLLQTQKDELLKAQTGLVDIAEKYEALQATKQPGAEGVPADQQAIGKAKLSLLKSILQAGPIAQSQFKAARGMTDEALFGEELLGLQLESAQSLIAQRRAQTQQLLQPMMVPEKASEQKARNEWITGLSNRMVKRYGAMKVAGIGEVAGVEDVRDKKAQFFRTEWQENQLVVAAVDTLKQTGAFRGVQLDELLYNSSTLGAKGSAVLGAVRTKLEQLEQEKGEAKAEARQAIDTLLKRRQQLATKASLFGLVEGLVERREQAINAVVEDSYATSRDQPQWAAQTEALTKGALSGEAEVWRELLNDPDFVADVERYRNTAAPYSETWIKTAGGLTARLKARGIQDPTLIRYILSLIRMSNPAYALTREAKP